MDGVHDMGGMHGFGPVEWESDAPPFHEVWEARLNAINSAVSVPLYPNLDASRYALEALPPAVYLGSSYYERWLLRAERRLIELGVLTSQELDERIAFYAANPDAPVPRGTNAESLTRARARFVGASASLHRPAGAQPRFTVGDAVRTKNIHPAGHTRLPRYARGKRGLIARVHGSHDFPDTRAHGLGDNPQGIYSVRFEARELWGEAAEPHQWVHLDLWDAYLEPVNPGSLIALQALFMIGDGPQS